MEHPQQNILVIDDHALMRSGVINLIEDSVLDVKIHATGNPYEALNIIKEIHIDLIITDLKMPIMNGLEFLEAAKETDKNARCMILSVNSDPDIVKKAMNIGAYSYILKGSSSKELLRGVEAVLRGTKYIDSNILIDLGEKEEDDSEQIPLTQKELQVLNLILEEKTNSEIADELDMAISTVKTHKSNIMGKTNSKNTVSLVKYAYENGLFRH